MSTHFLAAATLLLSATLQAQTPPCESRNDSTDAVSGSITASPFVGNNPSRYAYQFSPANTIIVESASIFTESPGGSDRYLRIEIWSSDDAIQEPMAILARGSCKVTANAQWYGVNFDSVLPLIAGTNYWFVAVQPGFLTLFEQPGGTLLPRRIAQTTTPSWGSINPSPLKMRLFCNRLDGATVVPDGEPCANSLGQLGTCFTNDAPSVGNADFRLQGTNLPGGAAATLLIGFDLAFPSIDLGFLGLPAGCFLHTEGATSASGTVGVAEIGDSGHPSPIGHVEWNLGIPNNATLSGLTFESQIFAVDAGIGTAIPLISTNSLQVTITP